MIHLTAMTRYLLPGLLSSLVACSSETRPPTTPQAMPATPATATTPAPATPPATTAAPVPSPSTTADLGSMSNDPEVSRQIRTDVMKAIQPSRPQMRVCYNDAVRKNAKMAGEITIRLTVAPNGEAVVIDDEGSSIKDKEFVTCVRAVLSNVRYPRWQGKAVTVVVPIEFFRVVEASP